MNTDCTSLAATGPGSVAPLALGVVLVLVGFVLIRRHLKRTSIVVLGLPLLALGSLAVLALPTAAHAQENCPHNPAMPVVVASAAPGTPQLTTTPAPVTTTASVAPSVTASPTVSAPSTPPQSPSPTPTSTTPVRRTYVALGDSFSAGNGTFSDTDPTCYRGIRGYPQLLTDAYGLTLSYSSCSGAKILDVAATQLSALSADTAYVTLTAGGNDLGYAKLIRYCMTDDALCAAQLVTANTLMDGAVPNRLATLYGQIKAAAPNAEVVVAGYPYIFTAGSCSAYPDFSAQERTQMVALTDRLNTQIKAQAQAHGFTYVDTAPAFSNHSLCDAAPYFTGVNPSLWDSFHPSPAGNQAYTDLVARALGLA